MEIWCLSLRLFGKTVIPNINERLRGNDDQKKKNKTKAQEKTTAPCTNENSVQQLQPVDNISFQQDTEQVNRTNRCLSDTLQNISHPFTGSVSVSDILNDLSYDLSTDFRNVLKEPNRKKKKKRKF